MGSNPLNLAVRFLLELAALFAMAYWGWTQHGGFIRIILAVGTPLVAAVLWGTFAVPNDPSRSGKAPVPVPGIIRLILELAIFAAGAMAFFASGLTTVGLIFSAVAILHYLVSYDRIVWLLRN